VTGLPKRTLDELRTRYLLEPSLADVFVEGSFDHDLLRSFYRSKKNRPEIYTIDSVEVPGTVLDLYNLTTGNKQRVIAASKQLADLPGPLKLWFVVDRDLDTLLGGVEVSPRLMWTKYSCTEAYFLSSDMVRNIVVDGGGCNISDWDAFYSFLTDVLVIHFSLRVASARLGLDMEWVDVDECISGKLGAYAFDTDAFITKLVHKNKKYARKHDLVEAFGIARDEAVGDVRLFMRSHDFTDLLAWAIKANKGHKEIAFSKAIERLFVVKAESVGELGDLLS
jgi:hypothetical protein